MQINMWVMASGIVGSCAVAGVVVPPQFDRAMEALIDSRDEAVRRSIPIVGYGYSPQALTNPDQHFPHPDQQMFLRGFELGLGQTADSFRTVLAMDLKSSVDGVVWAASSLADAGAVVIAGFPRSAEAVLAVSVGRSRRITMLFPAAGDPLLSQMGPGVYATGGTMRGAVEDTLDLVYQRFYEQRGMIVFRNHSSISKGGGREIAAWLKGEGDRGDKYNTLRDRLSTVVLDEQLRFSPEDVEALRALDYLVLTVSPLESVALLDQLQRVGLDLPLIVVSSWTTGDAGVVRRWIDTKQEAVYSMGVMVLGATTTKEFANIVAQEEVASGQLNYFAHGFDVGVIVRETLSRINAAGAPATPATFRTALAMSTEFHGVSTGVLRLPSEGGQADRSAAYVRYAGNGRWQLLEGINSPSQRRELERVMPAAESVQEPTPQDPGGA